MINKFAEKSRIVETIMDKLKVERNKLIQEGNDPYATLNPVEARKMMYQEAIRRYEAREY